MSKISCMRKFNFNINGSVVSLKSFPERITTQLNDCIISTLANRQYHVATIHVDIHDLLQTNKVVGIISSLC